MLLLSINTKCLQCFHEIVVCNKLTTSLCWLVSFTISSSPNGFEWDFNVWKQRKSFLLRGPFLLKTPEEFWGSKGSLFSIPLLVDPK